jgi:tetratricopeptide (TPR) repeat protein
LTLDHPFDEAIRSQTLALFRQVGDRLGEANTIYAMGEVARKTGAHAEAKRHYQWAVETYEAIGGRLGQANVLDSLGELAEAQGAWQEAVEWFARALAVYEAIGAPYARVTRRNLERVRARLP